MPSVKNTLSLVRDHDKKFAGTIAFRNEKITLHDGSKLAIGIDSERWVILYQKAPSEHFVIYEYNAETHTLFVDKKPGTEDDYNMMVKLVNNFLEHAEVSDVVTIEAGRKNNV